MRPSRDQTTMLHAHVAAKRGTCSRLQVGVVVARDHRILVTGYNGAVTGMDHCSHVCCGIPCSMNHLRHVKECPAHPDNPCTVAVHAEANAIAFAARYGVTLDGTEMFTTHAPCYGCAQLIVNAGIMRVVYGLPYRLTDGVELLAAAGVEVKWMIEK